MSRKSVGRGFKVTRKDVDGYGYAKPRSSSMRSNPGVTTIAAINGRGAFAASRRRTPTRSLTARQTMAGLSPRQRKNRATTLTNQERSQFSKRVREAREKAMKRKGTRRRNAAPSAKQLAAQKRFAAMARSGKFKRKRNSRKRSAAKRPTKRKRNVTKSLFSRVIRRKSAGRVTRRKNPKRRRRNAAKRTTTVKRKRRRVAAKRATPIKRRRRRAAKRATPVRRKRRRSAAKKTTVRRKRRKNPRRRAAAPRRRRVSRKRRRRNGRRVAKRRTSTKRRSPARKRSSGKRRTTRRSSGKRRASTKRRRSSRRRKNSSGFFSKLFRRNPSGLVALAAVGTGGYFAHRLAANLISMGLAKMPSLAPYSGAIGSVLSAVVGIPLVLKAVDDVNVKQSLVTGMFVSAVQGLIVGLMKASAPAVAEFLSGDDTAAKLSAMYGFRGLGQGTSIMPRYAPINGMGEYYAATRPMGEYFSTPMSGGGGMGEYFESGVEGLGNYTGNPYAMQAAAGYGAAETANTNHIDPSSNLDHELTIAEAAAGIGQFNYQAAAGLPRYEAQAGGFGEYFSTPMHGLGNVETVGTASTWIPGSADPQIWAGVRAVDRSQEETAEVAAGVLATPGGAGILG